MKKIIFFAYDLNVGGIETSLVNLLNHLDYHKYDVTLVLEKKQGIFLQKINPLVHVKEYRISNNKFLLFRKGYNFIKRFIWSLLNRNKYDFSCLYATYSLSGSKLAKIASDNSSIFIHGDYTLMYKDDELKDFFNVRGLDKFKAIFFVSKESSENLGKLYPELKDRFKVLNNFINNDEIVKLSSEEISLEKKHDILFVFVGRLDEKSKKIFRLLEIVNNLKNKFSIELWIVGGGEDKGYKKYINENNIEDNVILTGSKQNPYPYMKKADYIILTSDYEGFPVVYLESIALCKKIITTVDVSDGFISIRDNFGYIISKDVVKASREVEKILKEDNLNYKKLNFKKMDTEKIKILDDIIEGAKQ